MHFLCGTGKSVMLEIQKETSANLKIDDPLEETSSTQLPLPCKHVDWHSKIH